MKPGRAIALRAVTATAAIALVAGALWAGWDALGRRTIARVTFAGDTGRVPVADLERLAAGLRGRPARDVALPAVREAVRRLAWVRDCAVRRRFPDGLEISVETHVPLARWDETRLVSDRGEVFAADFDGPLPAFSGPEGYAADLARRWPAVLAAAKGLPGPVVELRLSARHAWQAKLASGLAIELGRGDIEGRLARFAKAWPAIATEAATATHADLRYPNGFALRDPAALERKPAPKGRRA